MAGVAAVMVAGFAIAQSRDIQYAMVPVGPTDSGTTVVRHAIYDWEDDVALTAGEHLHPDGTRLAFQTWAQDYSELRVFGGAEEVFVNDLDFDYSAEMVGSAQPGPGQPRVAVYWGPDLEPVTFRPPGTDWAEAVFVRWRIFGNARGPVTGSILRPFWTDSYQWDWLPVDGFAGIDVVVVGGEDPAQGFMAVGNALDPVAGPQGLIWPDDGGVERLQSLGGWTRVNDVSPPGVAWWSVGAAGAADGQSHAVAWLGSELVHDLHEFGPEWSSEAIAIEGQMVGSDLPGVIGYRFRESERTPVLWEYPGLAEPAIDIPSLLPPQHRWETDSSFEVTSLLRRPSQHITGAANWRGPNGRLHRRGYILVRQIPEMMLRPTHDFRAGEVNRFEVGGALRRAYIFWSHHGGGTLVDDCPGIDDAMSLDDPRLLGSVEMRPMQNYFDFYAPPDAGRLGKIVMQAVDRDGCRVSNVVVVEFR